MSVCKTVITSAGNLPQCLREGVQRRYWEQISSTLTDNLRNYFRRQTQPSVNDYGPEHFGNQFIRSGRYTAGLTATYDDSILTYGRRSMQKLASDLIVGMRLPSTQVVRFADAKAMQLVKALPTDGEMAYRRICWGSEKFSERQAFRQSRFVSLLE
jgi:hypothetical protein